MKSLFEENEDTMVSTPPLLSLISTTPYPPFPTSKNTNPILEELHSINNYLACSNNELRIQLRRYIMKNTSKCGDFGRAIEGFDK